MEFKDGKHSLESMQFIVTVINNEKFRFCYGRNCTGGLDDLTIKLPSKDGHPDYLFMEKYIKSLCIEVSNIPDYFLNDGYKKSCWYLDNVNQNLFESEFAGRLIEHSIQLSERKWSEFTLGDIKNGKSYNASDLVVAADGVDYVCYVTRTDENNGISMFVQSIEYEGLEKANAITVGDTTATAFFQEHDFITGPHIIVIRADWLNVYTANFIITLLNQEKYRYPVFGRAFTKDLIANTKLYLPTDDNGNPDYQFMEDYIKSLPFSQKL